MTTRGRRACISTVMYGRSAISCQRPKQAYNSMVRKRMFSALSCPVSTN